ncbi:MAG TPA: hypothetical protein VF529_06095 [Solirubrobacteraceae bacterium]|jgi:hypothetical protein
MPDEHRNPSARDARATRVAAARSLGQRLDGIVEIVARVPRWLAWTAFAASVVGTSPLVSPSVHVAGLQTDSPALAWIVQYALLALAVTVLVGCFFVVRAVVAYIEEGRWPKRAGGVDVGEYDAAVDQVDRAAERLSAGSDAFETLDRQLREASRVIRYLVSELERARGDPPPPGEERSEDDAQEHSG